ncbi:MAG: hypothetical protein ACYC61_00965 [Isosphaeraceae bacterium]
MTSTSLHLPLPLRPEALDLLPDRSPTRGDLDVPPAVPTNGQPMTLPEVIEHEAMAYRAWGTPAGDFLARQMERLAQLVRWTGATTPEDHEARMEVWDDELREQWYERGYQDGVDAGRHDAARMRFEERY